MQSYGNAPRPSICPPHFLVKSITLQRSSYNGEIWYRFFWLNSPTSSNVGHLDLLSWSPQLAGASRPLRSTCSFLSLPFSPGNYREPLFVLCFLLAKGFFAGVQPRSLMCSEWLSVSMPLSLAGLVKAGTCLRG